MAITLAVNDFSCIKKARLVVSPLTVIIGPQASGKSVLSKLNFFFVSLWTEQFSSLEDGDDLDAFKERIRERFSQNFPTTAWGASKFIIEFHAGKWGIKLARTIKKGAVSDGIRITFSEYFEAHYVALQERILALKKKLPSDSTMDFMELSWELREMSQKILTKDIGDEFFPYQMFIPAGRSFFTNAGKAVMLLEQGNMVDPFIARFGRYFANARDRVMFRGGAAPNASNKVFDALTTEILGGSVRRDRASEYLEAKDGRKIPFMVLSSGQQELLPLVIALKFWGPFVPRRQGASLMYIEEPEAHLFPSAQSKLVEILALIVNSNVKRRNSLVITTHSPYVLAKLNNLIHAGVLSQKESVSKTAVDKIIPKHAWLAPGVVTAYGLEDGVLMEIMDSSGLIDGQYLDRVSGDIAEEFNKLLGLEFSNVVGRS